MKHQHHHARPLSHDGKKARLAKWLVKEATRLLRRHHCRDRNDIGHEWKSEAVDEGTIRRKFWFPKGTERREGQPPSLRARRKRRRRIVRSRRPKSLLPRQRSGLRAPRKEAEGGN